MTHQWRTSDGLFWEDSDPARLARFVRHWEAGLDVAVGESVDPRAKALDSVELDLFALRRSERGGADAETRADLTVRLQGHIAELSRAIAAATHGRCA